MTTAETATATPSPTSADEASPARTPPVVLDGPGLAAAYDEVLDLSSVRILTESSTAVQFQDGSELVMESVLVEEIVAGNVTVGHATFTGEATIRQARSGGNEALADLMLSTGVEFRSDGAIVLVPREVGVALDVGIPVDGTPWIGVDRSRLDETEAFALVLIAPAQSGLRAVSGDGDFIAAQVGRSDESTIYGYEDTETGGVLAIEVDADGVLRGLSQRGPFPGVDGGVFRSQVLFDPHDGEIPAPLDPAEWEDVTAAFREYVAVRLAQAPSTVGG